MLENLVHGMYFALSKNNCRRFKPRIQNQFFSWQIMLFSPQKSTLRFLIDLIVDFLSIHHLSVETSEIKNLCNLMVLGWYHQHLNSISREKHTSCTSMGIWAQGVYIFCSAPAQSVKQQSCKFSLYFGYTIITLASSLEDWSIEYFFIRYLFFMLYVMITSNVLLVVGSTF